MSFLWKRITWLAAHLTMHLRVIWPMRRQPSKHLPLAIFLWPQKQQTHVGLLEELAFGIMFCSQRTSGSILGIQQIDTLLRSCTVNFHLLFHFCRQSNGLCHQVKLWDIRATSKESLKTSHFPMRMKGYGFVLTEFGSLFINAELDNIKECASTSGYTTNEEKSVIKGLYNSQELKRHLSERNKAIWKNKAIKYLGTPISDKLNDLRKSSLLLSLVKNQQASWSMPHLLWLEYASRLVKLKPCSNFYSAFTIWSTTLPY